MFSRFFNINKNIIIIIIIKIIIINIINIRNKVVNILNNSAEISLRGGKAINTRSKKVVSINIRGSFIRERRSRNRLFKAANKSRADIINKKNENDR